MMNKFLNEQIASYNGLPFNPPNGAMRPTISWNNWPRRLVH